MPAAVDRSRLRAHAPTRPPPSPDVYVTAVWENSKRKADTDALED